MYVQYWLVLMLLELCLDSGVVGPQEIDTNPEVLSASLQTDGLEDV
jgi:hypothetical protein